jgi:hypothetical protein
MCILGLAYERAIFQLLDLKTKKEFEFSHHRHFKPISHDLAKFITKRFVRRTKDYVIHIDLAYKKIFVYSSCEKIGSALPILKSLSMRKFVRHSYHALGACLSS